MDFVDYYASFPDENSATDNEALNAHPRRWRAVKTAWRIIINHRHEVQSIAKDLSASVTGVSEFCSMVAWFDMVFRPFR
jgi:hypothetical protein